MEPIHVLTGTAAIQKIDFTYDQPGWEVVSPTAVRVQSVESDHQTTKVNLLLGTGKASILLKPKARDVTTEATQFFVESSNLYLPGPGVVDGRHRLHIRTAQSQLQDLNVLVPSGLLSPVG